MKNKISMNLEVSLIEIIISILIFAVAGAIMLNCFAAARFIQIKANDKVEAGNIIQSNTEIIKSFDDISKLDNYLSDNYFLQKENSNEKTYINYYDKTWVKCDAQNKEYIVSFKLSDNKTISGEIIKLNIIAEKVTPYPFIDKNNDIDNIYEIETTKFFPTYEARR